jgi:hypothetical protein
MRTIPWEEQLKRMREGNEKYYAEHPRARVDPFANWKATNPEGVAAKLEKLSETHRRLYQENPEHLDQLNRELTPEIRRAFTKQYIQENPEKFKKTIAENNAKLLIWQSQHVEEVAETARRIQKIAVSHPNSQEPRWRKLQEKIKTIPMFQAGPQNRFSRDWFFKSPNGPCFQWKNLRNFVETHENLFLPEQVDWVWRPSSARKLGGHIMQRWCCAWAGLQKLSPRNKHPNLNWCGWTWDHESAMASNQPVPPPV